MYVCPRKGEFIACLKVLMMFLLLITIHMKKNKDDKMLFKDIDNGILLASMR
jgi:hypothetical protein